MIDHVLVTTGGTVMLLLIAAVHGSTDRRESLMSDVHGVAHPPAVIYLVQERLVDRATLCASDAPSLYIYA